MPSTAVLTPQETEWDSLVVRDPDGGRSYKVPFQLEYIEVSKLFVDYHESVLSVDEETAEGAVLAYQRKGDRIMKRIEKAGPESHLFGALLVNERIPNERYAIIDGGTRFRAYVKLGIPGDVRLPCLVFRLSDYAEIDSYVDNNTERAGLTPVNKFVGKLKRGDPEALEIEQILQRYTQCSMSMRRNDWQCVNAVEDSHDKGTLETVMGIITQLGWHEMPSGKTQQIVGGVDYCVRAGADPTEAIARWRTLTPASVKTKANSLSGLGDIGSGSRSLAKYYAVVLGREYDARRRTGRLEMTLRLFNVDVDG